MLAMTSVESVGSSSVAPLDGNGLLNANRDVDYRKWILQSQGTRHDCISLSSKF